MLEQRECVYWSLKGFLFTTWFYVVIRSINSTALMQIRLGQDAKTAGYLKGKASNKIHKQVWCYALSSELSHALLCCLFGFFAGYQLTSFLPFSSLKEDEVMPAKFEDDLIWVAADTPLSDSAFLSNKIKDLCGELPIFWLRPTYSTSKLLL